MLRYRALLQSRSGLNRAIRSQISMFSNNTETLDTGGLSTGVPSEVELTQRYTAAIAKMRSNKVNYEQQLSADRRISLDPTAVFQNTSLASGFTAMPPKVGDLVEVIGYGPSVVIRLPTEEEPDMCLLYMSSGRLKRFHKSKIAFTLGEYVKPSALEDSIRVVRSDGEESDHIIEPVRRALYLPLRKFIENSYNQLESAAVELSSIFSKLQKPDVAVNVPFFDLVREVDYRFRLMKGQQPSEDGLVALSGKFPPPSEYSSEYGMSSVAPSVTHIVYTAICHNFSRSVLTDLGPWGSGSFTVTILSKQEVARREASPKLLLSENKGDAIPGKESSQDSLLKLAKKYALGDINLDDADAMSAAIMTIRNMEKYDGQVVEPRLALRLLAELGMIDRNVGPFIDRERFAFFKRAQNETPSRISDVSALPDYMESIRVDASPDPVFCIDAATAEEIDDGISVSKSGNIANVTIHIADPASIYDRLDETTNTGDILTRAYHSTASAYFPSGSYPMLPKEFTDKLGLVPGEGRRSFSMSFQYDLEQQKIVENSSNVSVKFVKNLVPITYDEVDKIIAGGVQSSYAENLCLLHEIAVGLWKKRIENHALELRLSKRVVSIDDSTGDIDVAIISTGTGHAERLVSEMMITANTITAQYTDKNGLSNMYRTQSIRLDTPREKGEYKEMISKYPSLLGAPEDVSLRAIKFMRPAQLSVEPGLHAALGLTHYSHSTSPLRRLQDILAHWQMESFLRDGSKSKRLLNNNQMLVIMKRIESSQRLIKSAQSSSITYWTLKRIEQFIGESATTTPPLFTAIVFSQILGSHGKQTVYLKDWGVYAQLKVDLSVQSAPYAEGTILECMVDSIETLALDITMRR